MAAVLLLAGSPAPVSRSAAVLGVAGARLRAAGHTVAAVDIKALPPAALLAGDGTDPQIAAVVEQIAAAEAIVVGTPIYKAAYSGLLKALLDLLPQAGFAGKAVLPLATGGTLAHVLAIDYALRPVLSSLGARHILPGYFVLDHGAALAEDGTLALDPQTTDGLARSVDGLLAALDPPVRLERAS